MYLGMLLIMSGIALFLGSAVAFCVLPLFVVFMNVWQIAPEEEALKALFGDQYTAYLSNVRRWI